MRAVEETGAQAGVYDAVVVGGGPRALSLVERLTARLAADTGEVRASLAPLRVVLVDAIEVGPGATWRTDQTAQFLNNTTSSATTIYPDTSTPIDGPLGDGPTFMEWVESVIAADSHQISWVLDEARHVTPGSFPSRRLQGVYYAEQLDRAERQGRVEITRVIGRVVDLTRNLAADAGSVDSTTVHLGDGRDFTGRTAVLAQGMVQARPDTATRALARAAAATDLLYISPGMPAEKPWDQVPAGEPVIVQGLGANFFDVVAELTAGRGGRFEEISGDLSGRLCYTPSGHEPQLFAGSRRGVPYRSKGDIGDGRAPKFVPRFATPDRFAALSLDAPGSLTFGGDVWPMIGADMAFAYLEKLAQRDPDAVPGGLEAATSDLELLVHRRHADAATATAAIDAVLAQHLNRPDGHPEAFRLDHLRRPTGGITVTADTWGGHVRDLIELELDSIRNPETSPRQAVNLAMGGLRGAASRLAGTGVIEGASVVAEVHGWFNADGLFLASGPPATRTREVLALIAAGIVTLIGPETHVQFDEAGRHFVASSRISGRSVEAQALIETRMSKGKVPNTDDPLMRALLETGRGRVHALATADGSTVLTDSIEAVPPRNTRRPRTGDTRPPLALVNADGDADPGILVLGIPALSTQPGSAIGATPGLPSPLLTGTDIAAAQVIERSRIAHPVQGTPRASTLRGHDRTPLASNSG